VKFGGLHTGIAKLHTLFTAERKDCTLFSLAVVEADPAYGRALRAVLEAEEFRVRFYESAEAALSAIHSTAFDLYLLDLDIPGRDGVALCGEMRRENPIVPIIGATERADDWPRVDALIAGADDVVAKRTNGRELVARILAVLRRSGKETAAAAYQDEELTVLLDEMRVIVRGQPVPLSLGETRLLAMLIREAPAPLSLERIRSELAVRESTIVARVKSLRQKLGRQRIEMRPRYGYVFVG
jgi:DNA-binding response OmpR family regulator